MGTRSIIALALPNGSYKSIYCHWDGYPQSPGVGSVLLDHYQDEVKVKQLLRLGSLSAIGPEIGTKHPFNPPSYAPEVTEEHNRLYGSMCLAYGRDRGEKNVRARTHQTFKGLARSALSHGAEYLYLLYYGTWMFTPVRASAPDGGDLTILTRDITHPEVETVTS